MGRQVQAKRILFKEVSRDREKVLFPKPSRIYSE